MSWRDDLNFEIILQKIRDKEIDIKCIHGFGYGDGCVECKKIFGD